MSESAKKEKPAKQIVYSLSRASRCHNCDRKLAPGDLVKLHNLEDERQALCRTCCKLDGLELIGKGNAKITRLATKYSEESYIVMKWSELWKTYERLGVLADPGAVDRAEQESGEKLLKRESRPKAT